jgi:hypothetical protein
MVQIKITKAPGKDLLSVMHALYPYMMLVANCQLLNTMEDNRSMSIIHRLLETQVLKPTRPSQNLRRMAMLQSLVPPIELHVLEESAQCPNEIHEFSHINYPKAMGEGIHKVN